VALQKNVLNLTKHCITVIMNFLHDIPKLRTECSDLREGAISLEECTRALKQMQHNKSPGPTVTSRVVYLCLPFHRENFCKVYLPSLVGWDTAAVSATVSCHTNLYRQRRSRLVIKLANHFTLKL